MPRHRSQLLNYLLLMEQPHGKLINFGTRQVEHEFVNTKLTHADRAAFALDDKCWKPSDGFGIAEKNLVLDFLHDWGVGLDCALYKEVLMHFLPNKNRIPQKRNVFCSGQCIAQQPLSLCGESAAIHVTTFQNGNLGLERELMRLMNATRLESLQWINIAREKVTLKTLNNSAPHGSFKKWHVAEEKLPSRS